MFYRSIHEFLEDWSQEEALTLKVLETLTDESLQQSVSATQARTLGDLGWHLTSALGAMLAAAGLQIDGPDYTASKPDSASDILEGYRRMSDAVANAVKQQWSNEKLSESLLLFGFMKTTYSGVLNTVVRHQIHHRGQMTILMRQAALVPPGVYGPNEEESAAMRAKK
ncbi:putative damage-inducible protein DinB [Fontibacillus phaseoli]|uniref:Putative damage-inducible protein DinB n=1 Tax=Fontibacillus phaseoli TaxID=1416533 RepID=A0A369BTR7_9BACL|nr:DinB family protein [Fontibacillus phaseoli]RCX23807.1 putative damage-inducible protein DinB [Fontibacillus phaseoli]